MDLPQESVGVVRKPPLGQIVLYSGCCCGKMERGFAPMPVGQFKSIWKAENLNRTIQLTVSGCLRPCEMANVALLLTPDALEWVGRLHGQGLYDGLIDWAPRCHAAQALLQPPDVLRL